LSVILQEKNFNGDNHQKTFDSHDTGFLEKKRTMSWVNGNPNSNTVFLIFFEDPKAPWVL
jgi:hypothetical protein